MSVRSQHVSLHPTLPRVSLTSRLFPHKGSLHWMRKSQLWLGQWEGRGSLYPSAGPSLKSYAHHPQPSTGTTRLDSALMSYPELPMVTPQHDFISPSRIRKAQLWQGGQGGERGIVPLCRTFPEVLRQSSEDTLMSIIVYCEIWVSLYTTIVDNSLSHS